MDAKEAINNLKSTIIAISSQEKENSLNLNIKQKTNNKNNYFWHPKEKHTKFVGKGVSPGLVIGKIQVVMQEKLIVPDIPSSFLEGCERLDRAFP